MSDLHVGKGARAKDFSPYPDHDARDSGYKDSFTKYIKDNELRADYLIVPGDVSDRGAPPELELASQIIIECALALHVARSNIVFVPGNHDADWTVFQQPDPTGFRRAQKFAPLQNDSWVFEQVIGRATKHLLKDKHSFSVWEHDDLLVVGYNSAWSDEANAAVHHGLAANEHLDALERELTSIDLGPHRLRLFLVHHHPVIYSDPLPDEPDFSAMTNAPRLLSILRANHFDLLIHGHRHSPVFHTQAINSEFPLAILSAGSFSAELDRRWSGLVNNQFHIVKIEGRERSTKCTYGYVQSWTYLAQHGWVPSQAHNGIRHMLPFGTYLLPHNLENTLLRMIKAAWSDADHILWKSLIEDTPRLKYLPPQAISQVLERLSVELDFTFMDGSAGLILLKNREAK